jgi:DNA gyrase inhibitor GyrI
MSEYNVRLVRLEKLRVASLHGFGTEPELQAWEKLVSFAGTRDLRRPRIFGFNNPDPTPGSPNYGYELWITIGPEVSAEGDVEIKEFPGGLYAVARCEATGEPYEVIPATWQQLVAWREQSAYQFGSQPWLEEHLPAEGKGLVQTAGGAFVLDLYLPLSEEK